MRITLSFFRLVSQSQIRPTERTGDSAPPRPAPARRRRRARVRRLLNDRLPLLRFRSGPGGPPLALPPHGSHTTCVSPHSAAPACCSPDCMTRRGHRRSRSDRYRTRRQITTAWRLCCGSDRICCCRLAPARHGRDRDSGPRPLRCVYRSGCDPERGIAFANAGNGETGKSKSRNGYYTHCQRPANWPQQSLKPNLRSRRSSACANFTPYHSTRIFGGPLTHTTSGFITRRGGERRVTGSDLSVHALRDRQFPDAGDLF